MTYNDLCAEVCALGFEPEIESEDRLLFATRRAMNIIFTERPLYKTLTLSKPKMIPSLKIECIEHSGGVTDTVSASAKAYSFITCGSGSYTVTDSFEKRTYFFNANEKLHRGFLRGDGKIEFTGDYFYTVYNIALFDELYGQNEKDIPLLDGFYEYDVKEYTNDFLSYVSMPEDENGHPITGASVSGNIISIPTEYCGRVLLKYKSAPTLIQGHENENLILPDGCEYLLPLLVAAYVWLDDDTDKAEYYMMLYRDGMAAVKAYNRVGVDTAYIVKDRWA